MGYLLRHFMADGIPVVVCAAITISIGVVGVWRRRAWKRMVAARGLIVLVVASDGEPVGPALRAPNMRWARDFRFTVRGLNHGSPRLDYVRPTEEEYYLARRRVHGGIEVRDPQGRVHLISLGGEGLLLPGRFALRIEDIRNRPRRPAGSAPNPARGFDPGKLRPAPPEDQEHFLSAEMPAQASEHAEISLIVRITSVAPAVVSAAMAPLRGLAVGAASTPLTVAIQSSRGLSSLGPLEQVIWVASSRDPDPVRFVFRTQVAGLQRVRVTAWSGGTFLCELVLEVSVRSDGRTVEGPARIAPLGQVRPNPGEVTLQIGADGDRYMFQLISESYLGRMVRTEALVADPSVAVERAITTLRELATGRSGYTEANAHRWMRETGVGLWNEMVPQVIKEEFWRLRDEISTFSIAATDDLVPWELLYPKAPGCDEGFLVEQFPVLRRTQGQGRATEVKIDAPRYVISAESPNNARDEIAVLQRIIGVGAVLDRLDDVLALIESGSPGLMHFACHNTFRPGGGGSTIAMNGGPFKPGLLSTAVADRALARHSPLVLMNACRTAGAVPEYTQMMGWAQQFMAAGAGAFAGTLWAVRSQSAASFAEAFYTSLNNGESLGQAARAARLETRRVDPDPSWLAYSVYGSPKATIARNPGEEDPWL